MFSGKNAVLSFGSFSCYVQDVAEIVKVHHLELEQAATKNEKGKVMDQRMDFAWKYVWSHSTCSK